MGYYIGTEFSDIIAPEWLSGGVIADPIDSFPNHTDDFIYGDDGDDFIDAGAGHDRIHGGRGADEMHGGDGNDQYFVDDVRDLAVEDWNDEFSGNDTVYSSVSYRIGEFIEELVLRGTDDINGTGNDGDNLILGNRGDNKLRGLGGSDTFRSMNGADIVIGGRGNDIFEYRSAGGSNRDERDRIMAGNDAVAFRGAGDGDGDRFDLRLFDADRTTEGPQTFEFGTDTGKGHLWMTTFGTRSFLNGNLDDDAAIEFQVAIHDGAVLHTAYTAADFIL